MLVHPEFFGVEREDLEGLDDQQCVSRAHAMDFARHWRWTWPARIPDKMEVMRQIARLGSKKSAAKDRNQWLHNVVIGGINPCGDCRHAKPVHRARGHCDGRERTTESDAETGPATA